MVLNVSVGHWYPKGLKRLMNSLSACDYAGQMMFWRNALPGLTSFKNNIYTAKPAAFAHAKESGSRYILWVDSSGWAVRDLHPIFNYIKIHGYYLGMSGYNCAQTCNDVCLDYFGINRDQAEKISDCATGVLGIDIESEIGKLFLDKWEQAAYDGVFNGSRAHDNQSSDPRFLFHRQDQSCASIIAHNLEMKLTPFGELVDYYREDMKQSVVIALRGI